MSKPDEVMIDADEREGLFHAEKMTNDDDDEADELTRLRRENAELKQLVRQGLREKLKWDDLPLAWKEHDREAVLEALRSRSVSWIDLPQKWKDDVDVACFLFQLQRRQRFQISFSFGVVPRSDKPLAWKDLPYHLMTNEKLIAVALEAHGGPEWNEVPLKFRNNPDIICAALKHDMISFNDVPIPLRTSHRQIAFHFIKKDLITADECTCFEDDFFRESVEKGDLKWNQIPTTLQTDTDFAQSISHDNMVRHHQDTNAAYRATVEIFHGILNSNPALGRDQTFWRRLRFPHDLFGQFASVEFRADREFMLEACSEEPFLISLADPRLARDRSFLSEVLAKNPEILRYLDHDTQLLYPDLVKGCLPVLGKLTAGRSSGDLQHRIAEKLEPSFFLNRAFIMEWIQADLGIPYGILPQNVLCAWMATQDVYVAHTKSAGVFHPRNHKVQGDCELMKEIVECHPRLYTEAVGKAREDPWVLTVALAGSAEFAKDFLLDLHINGKNNEIDSIVSFLRGKLSAFDTFSECILGNMLSTQSKSDTGSNLTLLNQGEETTLELKQTLAALLGIPTGKALRLLRDAERNAREAIAFWAGPSE